MKCQVLAKNPGLLGAYMAWLSDETHYAPDRVPTHAPISYSNRCDSGLNLVASNFDDLASGNHQNPISCDETAVDHLGDLDTQTWTGEFEPLDVRDACLGWTTSDYPNEGGYGLFDHNLYNPPIEHWINRGSDHCMTFHRLYCVEK